MAYATGIANSATDLVNAVNNACSLNGWSLDAPSGVLSKGTCHVRVMTAGTTNQHVKLEYGATSNFASPGYNFSTTFPYINLLQSWPVFYKIFILSDGAGGETVMLNVLEANQTEYKQLSFGFLANKVGAWTGGEWISGTYGSRSNASATGYIALSGGPGMQLTNVSGGDKDDAAGCTGHHAPVPFMMRDDDATFGGDNVTYQTYCRCDIDGLTQLNNRSVFNTTNTLDCMRFAKLPLARQPNTWNGESVLVPIHAMMHRASSTISRLGTVHGLRLMRMDNYEPGDIITLGPDRWMVLPIFRRNASQPLGDNPGFEVNDGHTGQFAFAVKYEGP
jgi:hypothetical protein